MISLTVKKIVNGYVMTSHYGAPKYETIETYHPDMAAVIKNMQTCWG